MDVSPEYIKQCERAEEIQPELQPFHVMESNADLFHHYHDVWFARYEDGEITKIWLPRQDQLQKMIAKREDVQHLLLHFYNKVGALFNEKDKYWLQFKSWEQLWFALVMSEKYSKTWNGEDWII